MTTDKVKDLRAIIEALIIAEGREARSHDFYVKAAQKAQNPAARKMLLALAEEEERHQGDMGKRIVEFRAELEKELRKRETEKA